MARRFLVSSLAAAAFAAGMTLWSLPAQADNTTFVHASNDTINVNNLFESDPAGAIQRAREAIAAGKMGDAIKQLKMYVASHPLEPAPRRFLGDLLFRTGDLRGATDQYQELVRQNNGDKESHNRLGTVYAVENRIDDAIAQFNAALPGTESVDDLVALHQRKGDLAKYEREMQRLSEQNPTDPAIQGEVGQVYNAIHQPYAASVHFRNALDQAPTDLTALNGLGLAMLSMSDYTGAINEFKACLRVDPAIYQCQNNMAAAQLESHHYDEAKRTLDRAYHLAPEHAETFVNYGYLADSQGDWQKAASLYAKAIDMDPYLRESYIDLALAYEEHKMYPLAQAALLKGLSAISDDGRLHFLLGKAYEGEGKNADAVAQFKLAANGSDPDAARIARTFFTNPSGLSPLPEKT